MDRSEQKKNIRRTALILTVVALLFFFGFIASGVLRA
jgi:hypothetical protein